MSSRSDSIYTTILVPVLLFGLGLTLAMLSGLGGFLPEEVAVVDSSGLGAVSSLWQLQLGGAIGVVFVVGALLFRSHWMDGDKDRARPLTREWSVLGDGLEGGPLRSSDLRGGLGPLELQVRRVLLEQEEVSAALSVDSPAQSATTLARGE